MVRLPAGHRAGSEPVSSSLADAFPHFKSLSGLGGLSAEAADGETGAELARDGATVLGPGTYRFTVQTFCLDVGRYAPGRESGYLLAPMKGERARTLSTLLKEATRRPEVAREDLQSLVWAIASGTRYRSLPDHLRALAEKLLPEGELLLLGKSYLQAVPSPLRGLLKDTLKSLLPPDLVRLAEDIEQARERLRERICDAAATYAELERLAVRFGTPPATAQAAGPRDDRSTDPGDDRPSGPMDRHEPRRGEWCLVDGILMRVLPEGYTKAVLEVHVPGPPLQFAHDHLGRVTRVEAPDGTAVTLTYSSDAGGTPIALRSGSSLDVWRFRELNFTLGGAEALAGPDDGAKGHGTDFAQTVDGWVAADPEGLAGLDPHTEAELSARIRAARDVIEDARVLGEVLTSTQTAGRPGDPYSDITDLGHYLDGIEAVLEDLAQGAGLRKKMEWLREHFRRLRAAYASTIARLAAAVRDERQLHERQLHEQHLRFSCPSDLVAVPLNPHEQRLGFRCAATKT